MDPVLKAEADSKTKVLIREHPMAGFSVKPSWKTELNDLEKDKAHDFINKCNKIYCLNSSVGLEALLLGREARIFGDSPFSNVCTLTEEFKILALNFIVFGYLVHRDLLFNDKYYRYRLENIGNEKEIYLDNMKRLLRKVGK